MTGEIKQLLTEIERLKILIDELPVSETVQETIRRKSILKSSLFSARIEGNPLTLDQVGMTTEYQGKNVHKREIFNIMRALNLIRSMRAPKTISLSFIKKLHNVVMNGISPDAGVFRTEVTAIFNSGGMAIYLTPPFQEIRPRLRELIAFSKKKHHPLIGAALTHFTFEKIHPFIDGNGRVGRIMSQYLLERLGYGCKGLVSFEHVLETYRQDYYDLLSINKTDVTEFVVFFLTAFKEESETVVSELKSPHTSASSNLLPRRQEILSIIQDHQLVSFDFLRRRFLRVSPSSLHYDLQQLLKHQLIKKLGLTKGVLYSVI